MHVPRQVHLTEHLQLSSRQDQDHATPLPLAASQKRCDTSKLGIQIFDIQCWERRGSTPGLIPVSKVSRPTVEEIMNTNEQPNTYVKVRCGR
ncbi:hypothetical protein SCLCIDRAFT_211964 [Scleroderma citrinum Foug A]|uniref:Uncharacterized protein n=1 Tax=Scleroderma citrinum Foug A TaxID=1036808 RepID=A0A0C3DK85_9AGAM|nr:hypothetical protein SCLCIDRAFT_211964 [Scleroderma citrinum Foug A]